jgi:hypothetical protein
MKTVTVEPRWYVILTRGPHQEQFHQSSVKDQVPGNANVRPIQYGNMPMLGLCAACRWARKSCREAFPMEGDVSAKSTKRYHMARTWTLEDVQNTTHALP